MNIRCCAIAAVMVCVAATSSAQPLTPSTSPSRGGGEPGGGNAFAKAARMLRAVERLDAPYDIPAKQRAITACRDAHVALWKAGLDDRIMRASPDAPATPHDLDAFWGLAYCTELSQYVGEDGSSEQIAAQRSALAHYRRYKDIEYRTGERTGVTEQVSRINYALIAMSLLEEEVAAEPAPAPAQGPIMTVRPEVEGDTEPMLRSAIMNGFDLIAKESYAKCYVWFHSIILAENLDARIQQHLNGEDVAFTPYDFDIMLGNARCAEGTIPTVDGGGAAVQERIVEAAHYYARYAGLDRRMGHEQDVQDADARQRALHEQYRGILEQQIAIDWKRAQPPPEKRLPVTLMETTTPEQRFQESLVGANNLLAVGYLDHAYTSFDILTVNPIGKDSPDVAWGMAKTTELSCAAIDDDALRLHWLGVARQWYARYVDIEKRPEHLHGAEARANRARIALRGLNQRIAALEEKVAAQDRLRAAAAAVASRGPLDSAGAGAGATNASAAAGALSHDGGSQDAEPPVATTAGAAPGNDPPPRQQPAPPPAAPPDIVAFQRAHPEYTLAELLCFTRYKMCRERMEIRHGIFYFFYDQFPPHGTQCPP